ncbi:ABC transporter ATP-binding protein [Convivina intestini]|uniref:Energy-coupling factor transport system ATP-binding protein n=1 Tax=Convivina intestini TaxID=1505726 RepID=A0A2U1DFB7_9LACO|nr:DUF3744 domain-containing protein [Convivina intestini]PVY86385.1 energy-coupling factor transport system ATP-binding protein [Convivina intestini]CAH1850551.1 Putative HMP/thiamine import ATP-binding protein YkoD [Convivina intestini]SDB83160.1 energy-coupling factor transport system ATP-binding protein [Leuconostocaceae bacterium R-53105]
MVAAALEFKGVTFKYDVQQNPTLENISLTIPKGSRTLIVGPSGSGKSTLAALLNGVIPNSQPGKVQGEIYIDGQLSNKDSIFERSLKIGTVLQNPDTQFVGMTVAEDIAFVLENDNDSHDQLVAKVQEWAKRLRLEELLDLAPQVLSGGQKQRVAMAGVLAGDSPILLFDEPLASLDPASGQAMLTLLDELQAELGLTVVIIEHRVEDVLRHAVDQVVVLQEGKIAYQGSTVELLKRSILPNYGLATPKYIQSLQDLGYPIDQLEAIDDVQKMTGPDLKSYLERGLAHQVSQSNDTTSPILTVKNLSYQYHNQAVFTDINFTLYQGEWLSLVGSNGAGKSTLSRLLAGFLPVQTGEISLNQEPEVDLNQLTLKERADYIGYVAQNPVEMLIETTVFDEVAAGLRLRGMATEDITAEVQRYLKWANLYEIRNWPVNVLSFGQKKRLSILSVAILQPKILILDEPTAGQDFQHAQQLMTLLQKLNQAGMTIVMVTHDVNIMQEWTSRVLALHQGKLIADTTPGELLANQEVVALADLCQPTDYILAQRLGVTVGKGGKRG